MKVILLENVPKLGQMYESKDVAPGYARNYLIPRGLAEIATDKSIAKIEMLRSLHAEKKQEEENRLMEELEKIHGKSISLQSKANEKGYLFAGIHTQEILPLISSELGIDLYPEHIALEKPIKEVGEHTVEVHIQDKSAKITVIVEAAK